MASTGQGGAPAGVVIVELRARVDALENDLRRAQARIQQFDQQVRTQRLSELERSAEDAGKAIRLLGGEIAALAGGLGAAPGSAMALASAFGRLGTAGAVAGVGIVAASAAVTKALSEWAKAETIMLTTEAIIKATGGAAGKSADEVAELSAAIGYATLASDELVQSAANVLLTFRAIDGLTFDRALRAASDLSAVGLGSITTAARTVGRALEDPVRGMDALRRVGVTLTASQKFLVQELYETGQAGKAMNIILEQIESRTQGAAQKQAEGLAGSFDKLTEAVGNWFERLGQIVDKETGVSKFFTALADALNKSRLESEKAETALGKYEAAQREVEKVQRVMAAEPPPQFVATGNAAADLYQILRELAHFLKTTNIDAIDLSPTEITIKTTKIGVKELEAALENLEKAANELQAAQVDDELKHWARESAVTKKLMDDLTNSVDKVRLSSEKEIKLFNMSDIEREVDAGMRKAMEGLKLDLLDPDTVKRQVDAIRAELTRLAEERRKFAAPQAVVGIMGVAATEQQRLAAATAVLDERIAKNKEQWDKLTPAMQASARAAAALGVEMATAGMRLSALGPLASTVEQLAQKMREVQFKGLRPEEIERVKEYNRALIDGTLALRAQADAARIETATLGMSTAAAAEYRAVQEKILENRRIGKIESEDDLRRWQQEARGIGEATQALERMRIAREVAFQAKTMFLSEQDVRIAQQLRGLYGDDIPRALASSEAAALRFLDNIKLARDLTADFVSGFATTFRQELQRGASAWEAFSNAGLQALNRLADRLIDLGLRQLVNELFAAGTKTLGINLTGSLLGGNALTSRGATPATPVWVAIAPGGLPFASTTATAIPGFPATATTGGAVGGGAPAVTTAALPSVASPSIAPSLPPLGGTGGSMIPGGGSFLTPPAATPVVPAGVPGGLGTGSQMIPPSGGGLTPSQLLQYPTYLRPNPNIEPSMPDVWPAPPAPSSSSMSGDPWFGFKPNAFTGSAGPTPGGVSMPAPDTITLQGGQPTLDFTNVPKMDFGKTFEQLNFGTLKTGQGAFGDVQFGQPWGGGGGQLSPDQLLRSPLASQGAFGGAPGGVPMGGVPTAPVFGAEGAAGFTQGASGGFTGALGGGGGLTGLGGLGSSFAKGLGGGGGGEGLGGFGGEDTNVGIGGGFSGGLGDGGDLSSEISELKDAFSETTESVTNFTDELTTGTDQFTTQMTSAVGSAAKFGTGLDVGGTKLTGFADGAVQQSTTAMATTATQTTTMGTAAVTTSTQVQQLGTAAQTSASQMSFGGGGGGGLFSGIFGGFFQKGGPIRGVGGPTDDKTLVAASPGEYMINAASTRKYRELIDLINSDKLEGLLIDLPKRGRVPIEMPRMAKGGPIGHQEPEPAEGVRPVSSKQYVPALARDAGDAPAGGRGMGRDSLGSEDSRQSVKFDTKIVNAIDGTSFLNEALASREGQRVIVNYMSANRSTVRQALGLVG